MYNITTDRYWYSQSVLTVLSAHRVCVLCNSSLKFASDLSSYIQPFNIVLISGYGAHVVC